MYKDKRVFSLIALLMVAVLTLTACGGGNDPAAGGDRTDLIVGHGADATTLDPQDSNDQPSSRVFRHIFDNLVDFDKDMNIVPSLAETWEVEEDGLTWNFKLKEGVKFHNGDELTSEDVKFTIERYKETGLVAHMLGLVEGIEIVDDYNFKLKTSEPFAALLPHLAHNSTGIMSKAATEEAGEDVGQKPIGTGPYMLEDWKAGDNIVLRRFEDFHGELPHMETITFKVIPEANNRTISLETGEVDIIYQVDPEDQGRIEEDENLVYYTSPAFSIQYMGMNTAKEPFNDVRVRRAINHAIDKEQLIDVILRGSGEPATQVLNSSLLGHNPEIEDYEYDPEKAKELLAEAGYPEGFEAELWTNDNQIRVRMTEMIQAQLREVGINLTLKTIEWGAYLEDTATGLQDMYMLGWSISTADADQGISGLYHSKNLGSGGNRSFYENDRVDELLDLGARENQDIEQREKYYQEAQQIIVDDAVSVFTYWDSYNAGLQPYVEGFSIEPTGFIDLTTVSFK